MKFDQTNRKDLRDLFCNAVTKIFGDSMTFLDFLENYEYSTMKYDCYLDYNGENYIINRDTGEYINWYKLDHIGRCINISTSSWYKNIPKWIEKFLIEFKESEEQNPCDTCEYEEGSIYCKEHCPHEAVNHQETITEFADRCRECGAKYGKLLKQKQSGNFTVLEDIKTEIKEWYWQADKQAIAKDPCVVDAMIDLFIRTIEKKESEV